MATKNAAKAARKSGATKTATKKASSAAGKRTASKRAAAKRPARPSGAQAAPPPALLERVGLMELSGKPATIVGTDVTVGQRAPDFTAQVGVWPGKDLWEAVAPLAETAGKVRILAPVPSLDTNTCNIETRRFNEEAAGLGDDIAIIFVSTDLPVAQKRWCGAAGADRVRVVSDHMAVEFGERYGALMRERRWLRRAVFVVDRAGVVRYSAYMPRLSVEPDYPAVLEAARQALADGQGASAP